MNSTNIPEFEYPTSTTANRIIGSIYFITCVTIIILTILMLSFYKKYPERQKSLPYKYIQHLEILGLVQQIIHLISSFFSIFVFRPPRIIERFLGSIVVSSYITCVTFMLFLTLNRLDFFYNQSIFASISRKTIYICCVIICYTEQCVFFILYNIPEFGLYYSLINDAWHFNKEYSNWVLGYEIEYFTVTVLLVIASFLYILILVKCFLLRRQQSNSINSEGIRKDLKLLIPPIINFVLCILLEFSWTSFDHFLKPSRYTSALQNFIWIIYSCNNTLVSIIMRKDVRKDIKRALLCRNNGINNIKKSIKIRQIKVC
uniref:G_PROTEIN_RECEP_F1_2 domain-containing protein n=1 Tax=Strongyloides venezuelensis TaxID=75913 RepID=A0A0K0F4C9_STRVS